MKGKSIFAAIFLLLGLLFAGCGDTTNNYNCCDECEVQCDDNLTLNNLYYLEAAYKASDMNTSIYPQKLMSFDISVPTDQRDVVVEAVVIRKPQADINFKDFHLEIYGEQWSCLHNFDYDEENLTIYFEGPETNGALRVSSGNSHQIDLMAYTEDGIIYDVNNTFSIVNIITRTDSELSENSPSSLPIVGNDINITVN